MSLKPILDALNNIKNNSKRLDKERLIGYYLSDEKIGNDFRETIKFALDPFVMFNTKRVDYNNKSQNKDVNKIFNYLKFLSSKDGCTNSERQILGKLSSIDESTIEVVKRIINKDLKCGASIKIFRKFIPDIPIFNVMLCIDELKKFFRSIKEDLSNTVYSIKLDGIKYLHTFRSRIYTNIFIYNNITNQKKKMIRELNDNKTIDDKS